MALTQKVTPTTNLSPLTTTFRPPDDCGKLQIWTESTSGQWGYTCHAVRQDREIETLVLVLESSCYPEGHVSFNERIGATGWTLPVYSPSTVCSLWIRAHLYD